MTKIKNLRRDIETMRETIRLHWQDLSSRNVTAVERDEIRQDIRSCIGDLENLLFRLDHLNPKSDSDTTSKSSSPQIRRAQGLCLPRRARRRPARRLRKERRLSIDVGGR